MIENADNVFYNTDSTTVSDGGQYGDDTPSTLYAVISPPGWDQTPPFINFDDAYEEALRLGNVNVGVEFDVVQLNRLLTVHTKPQVVTTYHSH